MIRIGILSDTHSYLHPRIPELFKECDEIWHCGDIGTMDICETLASIKPLRAVPGNIDGADIRRRFLETQVFTLENAKIMMTHIGGYPGKYDKKAFANILKHKPNLFICGHSHILKVMYDKKHNLLHINPGAAGQQGFHLVKTVIRFTIDNGQFKDLEVIELPAIDASAKPNNLSK